MGPRTSKQGFDQVYGKGKRRAAAEADPLKVNRLSKVELQKAKDILVRSKVQTFKKTVTGKYSEEQWLAAVDLALEWAGFHTVRLPDGSKGVLHCPPKLLQVLDVLNNIVVAWPGEPRRLLCPQCLLPHIDRHEWATKPHRTHLCAGCGHKWMPETINTVGVNEVVVEKGSNQCGWCGSRDAEHIAKAGNCPFRP